MWFVRLLLFASLMLASQSAAAQADPLSESEPAEEPTEEAARPASHVPYGMRNITTPEGTLAIMAGPLSNLDLNGGIVSGGFTAGLDFGLNVLFITNRFCQDGVCVEIDTPDPLYLQLGGAFGITRELEVGGLLLPLLLSPDVELGDPAVYGRYRLLTGDLEVAAQVMVFIPIDTSDLVVEAGAPIRLRGDLRVDTGVYARFDTGGDVGVRIPATLAYNVTESIFVGGRTAVIIPDFDNFGDGWVPLEAVGGYTIPGENGPLADITVAAGFPLFIILGDRLGFDDRIITEVFHVAAGANFYFGVL